MSKSVRLLALLLTAGFNLAVSYVTGGNGYIAFISTAIVLGILATWQMIKLIQAMLADRSWLVVKIGSLPLFAFAWFLLISGVALSITGGNSSAIATLPPLSWLAISIGVIAYLLPGLKAASTQRDVTVSVIGLITAIYSVVLFLIASLGYHELQLKDASLLLVVAVQLQYVMSYFALRTNYLERLYSAASRFSNKVSHENTRLGLDLTLFAVGLPFFIPIAIVVLVLAIQP